MPEVIRQRLEAVRRRARLRSGLLSLTAGAVVFALLLIVLASVVGLSKSVSVSVSGLAAVLVAATTIMRRRSMSLTDAAQHVEAMVLADNLIVSAAELIERPRPVRPEIQSAIAALAEARLSPISASQVVPIGQPLAVLIAVVSGCILLAAVSSPPPSAAGLSTPPAAAATPGFVVRITPPVYTGRPSEVIQQPVQITVIRGSHVRIERGNGSAIREWQAAHSMGMEVAVDDGPARFLSVIVVPDVAPTLRVVAPGRDTAFAEPKGSVAISVDARDDVGLASLTVKFTRASGGGENVTFSEGELPLRIERADARQWQARGDLVLESLNLADGDVVVYRAVGRDTNPAGEPVQSEPFLIEIGKNAVVADAGFALPAEERKYAISQQMVIYKTEQLIARGRVADALEQARGIAVEQRMVRAEVVFLGGGEVEDELEEAANSNELTEGRLQNTGRVEMLRAINAMSRAEAQLNEGRTQEALVLEKQALASLERALDRRRYFLRTLPDRSRIDNSRRLTGERKDARSWAMDTTSPEVRSRTDQIRAVMRELASAGGVTSDASLAARVAAIDPNAADLQQAAVTLASAATPAAQRTAIDSAMAAVSAYALSALPASVPVALPNRLYDGRLPEKSLAPGKLPR